MDNQIDEYWETEESVEREEEKIKCHSCQHFQAGWNYNEYDKAENYCSKYDLDSPQKEECEGYEQKSENIR